MFDINNIKTHEGFLLQKDVNTINLLSSNKLKEKIPKYRFVKIVEPWEIERRLQRKPPMKVQQIFYNHNDIMKHKLNYLKYKKRNFPMMLRFPLPKVKMPTLSAVDFYPDFKGEYKLCYIDDDCNITSRWNKKFIYSSQEKAVSSDKTDNSRMPPTKIKDNCFTSLGNSKLNYFSKQKTFNSVRPKKIDDNLSKFKFQSNDLTFKTQIKFEKK